MPPEPVLPATDLPVPFRRWPWLCRAVRQVAILAAVLGATTLALPRAGHAATLPPGFVLDPVPFVFDVPTAIAFLPDGRLLVAEKGGIVYLVDGVTRHPLWVHEAEVLNTDDRGLLAIAVDPHFDTNRFVYFLYTVDPDSNGIELDNYNDAFGRLVRYQVTAYGPTVVDESTRKVLIGRNWREGFASGSGSHTIADLEWGRDGTLFVSAGEGAHFTQPDAGGLDPGLFGPERTDPLEDIGAFRAQDLNSLDGKVLRVDPATGMGLASNPYFDGDPSSHRSRVWCYGLRNPFRIARRPGTGSSDPAAGNPGTLYVGDVGWNSWEEVNVARSSGLNFGWPCDEGPHAQPAYRAVHPTHHPCDSIGTAIDPATPTLPTVAYHHSDSAQSVPAGYLGGVLTGGTFYSGTTYPAAFRQGYFFGDYGHDWIQVLATDASDRVVDRYDFAVEAGGPVCFAVDPVSGDMFYVSIYTGQVQRIRYTLPVAVGPLSAPARLALAPPRPNPTRGAVAFALDLATASRVSFEVCDLAGRSIWRSPARDFATGRCELLWPGVTAAGAPARPGVYLASVRAGAITSVRRFVVVR